MHYYTWFPLKLPSILCFTRVSLIPSITLLVSSWERVLHFLHRLQGLMHHQDITDLQNITYLSGLWSFNQAKGKQTLASGTSKGYLLDSNILAQRVGLTISHISIRVKNVLQLYKTKFTFLKFCNVHPCIITLDEIEDCQVKEISK